MHIMGHTLYIIILKTHMHIKKNKVCITMPILQMRKLSPREVQCLAEEHATNKSQRQD